MRYKIFKYNLKKIKNRYVVSATVIKYKWGFVVDVFEEELCYDLKCNHEREKYYTSLQMAKPKDEVKKIVNFLNKQKV